MIGIRRLKYKVLFRLLAAWDVLTKERFELKAWDKHGTPTATNFDKQEIDNADL